MPGPEDVTSVEMKAGIESTEGGVARVRLTDVHGKVVRERLA